MRHPSSISLAALLLLFTLSVSCRKASQDTPQEPGQGDKTGQEAPPYASPARKMLTEAATGHLLNSFETDLETTDFYLDTPFRVDSTGVEFSKLSIAADEISSLSDGKDSCTVTFNDGQDLVLHYQNELEYRFTGENPFGARHSGYPGDSLSFPFTVTKGGHGSLSFNADVPGNGKATVNYDRDTRRGEINIPIPEEPGTNCEVTFSVKDKYSRASSKDTISAYHFNITPEIIRLPPTQGYKATDAIAIDTDIPECRFSLSRKEGTFFILDGTSVIVIEANTGDAPRPGWFEITESSGKLPPVRIIVRQDAESEAAGEESEPAVPESFALSPPSVLFKEFSGTFSLSPVWSGVPSSVTFAIDAFLDGKPVPVKVNGTEPSAAGGLALRETNAVTIEDTAGLKAGRHSLRLAIVPDAGGAACEKDYSVETEFDIYDIELRWFDEQDGREIYYMDCFWLEAQGDSFSVLPESLCPPATIRRVTLTDIADGSVCAESQRLGQRLSFSPARRGPHTYRIQATASDGTAFDWYKTIEVQESYECRLYISGNDLMAAITGYRSAPDARFQFFANGKVRGVIPYTEAIAEYGMHYTTDAFEYKDFEQFGFDFAAEKGQRFSDVKIFSGNLNSYASAASKHKKSLKAQKNKASRWKQNADGSWTKEYYTPEPYVCIEITIWFVKSGGEQMEYIDMWYVFPDITRLVESYGMKLKVLMSESER